MAEPVLPNIRDTSTWINYITISESYIGFWFFHPGDNHSVGRGNHSKYSWHDEVFLYFKLDIEISINKEYERQCRAGGFVPFSNIDFGKSQIGIIDKFGVKRYDHFIKGPHDRVLDKNGNIKKIKVRGPAILTTNVYFIQCETGPVKIGFAKDISKRLSTLQSGNPNKLKIVKTIENCKKTTEKELHNKYSEYRLSGEWFKSDVLLIENQPIDRGQKIV